MEVSSGLDEAITDELNQKVDIMAKGNKPQKNDKSKMKPKKAAVKKPSGSIFAAGTMK